MRTANKQIITQGNSGVPSTANKPTFIGTTPVSDPIAKPK